jgi:hypothetical protein
MFDFCETCEIESEISFAHGIGQCFDCQNLTLDTNEIEEDEN